MSDLSLEQLSVMSERSAVRRHFEHHNQARITLLVIFFGTIEGMAIGIALVMRHHGWAERLGLAGIVNLALIALVITVTKIQKRQPLWHETPGWIMPYLWLQYLILLLAHGGGEARIATAVAYPLLLIGLRLPAVQLFATHGVLVILSGLAAMLQPEKHSPVFVMLIASGMLNAGLFAVNALLSLEGRRSYLGGWRIDQHNAREQIRMREELTAARTIQLDMLPEAPPALDWLDLAAVSLPAAEVGGDYYDFHADGDRVAIMAADVAGHGLASGLVLSAIRSGFMLLRAECAQPAALLGRLHGLLAQTSRRRMLVTSALMILDRQRGVATIASAGQPPLMIRRAAGGVDTIELFSPPLGVRLPMSIPAADVPLSRGDVLVLHTDGVYETRNAAGESYGLERLRQALQRSTAPTAAAIRDEILRDVAAFRGATEQDDDVTVIVARVT